MTELRKVIAEVDEVAGRLAKVEECKRDRQQLDAAVLDGYRSVDGRIPDLRRRVGKLKEKADVHPDERTYAPSAVEKILKLHARFGEVCRVWSGLREWVERQQLAMGQSDIPDMLRAELGPGRYFVPGSSATVAFNSPIVLYRRADPLVWTCVVRGPRYSPYYGGQWSLSVKFPKDGGNPDVTSDDLPYFKALQPRQGWGTPPRLSNFLTALRRRMADSACVHEEAGLWARSRGLEEFERSLREAVGKCRLETDVVRTRSVLRLFLLAAARLQLVQSDVVTSALAPFLLSAAPPGHFIPAT